MNAKKIYKTLSSTALFSSMICGVYANPVETLNKAIEDGKVNVDARVRYENVDESGKDGDALTTRLRLGYETAPINGFTVFAEMEDVRAVIDNYNAAGLNGKASKSVIADVEDTELNRASIKYKSDMFMANLGRQRIILDDARFIGNVGWRQNEQTYDAALVSFTPVEGLNATLGYITDVNRIFGPDSGRDFDSESPIFNVSYSGLPIGKIAAFAYLLDFDNSAANSTDTYGFRWNGSQPMGEDFKFGYALSYATQSDGGSNPTSYDADYYSIDASLGFKMLTFGVGYEVLESDNGTVAFKTPLATAHKFNGWADKFLATPADGLEDLYFYLGAKLPMGVSGKLVYHTFDAETGSGDYGDEIDLVLKKAITKGLSATFKLADYSEDSSTSKGDVTKFSIQLDYKF